MAFFKYFKPDRRNLSLTVVVFLAFMFSAPISLAILNAILGTGMTKPSSEPQTIMLANTFLSAFIGSYVTASASIWWLEEHLQ